MPETPPSQRLLPRCSLGDPGALSTGKGLCLKGLLGHRPRGTLLQLYKLYTDTMVLLTPVVLCIPRCTKDIEQRHQPNKMSALSFAK